MAQNGLFLEVLEKDIIYGKLVQALKNFEYLGNINEDFLAHNFMLSL